MAEQTMRVRLRTGENGLTTESYSDTRKPEDLLSSIAHSMAAVLALLIEARSENAATACCTSTTPAKKARGTVQYADMPEPREGGGVRRAEPTVTSTRRHSYSRTSWRMAMLKSASRQQDEGNLAAPIRTRCWSQFNEPIGEHEFRAQACWFDVALWRRNAAGATP
jgi:hypothetical protein